MTHVYYNIIKKTIQDPYKNCVDSVFLTRSSVSEHNNIIRMYAYAFCCLYVFMTTEGVCTHFAQCLGSMGGGGGGGGCKVLKERHS